MRLFYQYSTGAQINANTGDLEEAVNYISEHLKIAHTIIKNNDKDRKPVEISVEIIDLTNQEIKATVTLFDNKATRTFYPKPEEPAAEVILYFMGARWELHKKTENDFLLIVPQIETGDDLVKYVNDNKLKVTNKHAFRYPEKFDY